jgi:hypothetical protein
MATPTLAITATLATAPVSRSGELQALQQLTEMAVTAARGAGGTSTSGTVNLPAAAGSATWTYTANAAS